MMKLDEIEMEDIIKGLEKQKNNLQDSFTIFPYEERNARRAASLVLEGLMDALKYADDQATHANMMRECFFDPEDVSR